MTARSLSICLSGALLIAVPAALRAQRPLNLDFELPSASYPDRPWGWTLGWSAFAGGPAAEFTLDTIGVSGARSLRITGTDSGSNPPLRAMMLQVPAGAFHGRALRLTGQVAATGGRAAILLEAWGDRVVVAGDTAVAGAGDAEWTPFDIRIGVPADTEVHSVVITVGVQGTGTARFDGFELRLDGEALSTLPAVAPPPSAAELAWLAAQSEPLYEVRAPPAGRRDDSDLALVARIVGNARVVGLGESTHGTREFFQVKHRILEYLVREHGFTVFAIEANQLAVERLNAWVLGGPGTARDAMRVLFRVWNTEEMLALVEWARDHNRTHPERPLRFVGYDMQDHQTPVDSLRAFLGRAAPGLLGRLEALTADYVAERSFATPHVPEATRAIWSSRADSLWLEVAPRRGAWLSAARTRADTVAVEWAVWNAGLFRQAARSNVALYSPERDSLMAANLDWALHTLYPEARTVVWAHDVHVSHGGDPERSFNAGAQMGAHLRHTYGHDYRAFSLLTREGTYSATRSFTDHEIIPVAAFPAPEGSVEDAISRVARPAASIGVVADLRGGMTDPGAAWLRVPRPIRHVGYAAYDYGFELLAVVPLEFDGVIYVERSDASRMLP